MELAANRFRQCMAAGPPRFGLWLGIPDGTAAEILAGAGFDWLVIDHEHGPFDVTGILQYLRALGPYEVAPIVRPVSDDPALLKKLLDIGVQTFMVPMVETAAQARDIVAALHYPPRGRRGLGTALARAAHWNATPDYLHRAGNELCLIIQVETVRALENLPAMLAVEGVDGVFIGPSDLSASMGHIGDAGHPAVVSAVRDALRTTRAAGRHAGILCLDPALSSGYIEAGADFVGVGVDTLLLRRAAAQLLADYRGDGAAAGTQSAGPGY